MNENETEDDTMEPTARKPQRRKVPPAEVIRGAPGADALPLLLDAEKVAKAGAVVELEVSADGSSILNPEDAGPKEASPTAPKTNWGDTLVWLAWSVGEGRSIGGRMGNQAAAIVAMAEELDDDVPKYLGGGFLLGRDAPDGHIRESDERCIVPLEMDVEGTKPHRHLLSLLARCSEFKELRDKAIQIRWSTRNRVQRGEPMKAKAKPVPLPDRMVWDGQHEAPWFLLDLSLSWWLIADDEERFQWLHHALMQCGIKSTKNGSESPYKRHPDMSAFTMTATRFGPKTLDEGRFVHAAVKHEGTEAKFLRWGFAEDDAQGHLFPAFVVSDAFRAPPEKTL